MHFVVSMHRLRIFNFEAWLPDNLRSLQSLTKSRMTTFVLRSRP